MDSFAFCGLSGCKPGGAVGGGSGKGLGLKAAVGSASRCRVITRRCEEGAGGAQPLPPARRRPQPEAGGDGIVGPKTSGAISAFQRKQLASARPTAWSTLACALTSGWPA